MEAVSISYAKKHFGEIMDTVCKKNEPMTVTGGSPGSVVIMSLKDAMKEGFIAEQNLDQLMGTQ